jgi:hypothetical protein
MVSKMMKKINVNITIDMPCISICDIVKVYKKTLAQFKETFSEHERLEIWRKYQIGVGSSMEDVTRVMSCVLYEKEERQKEKQRQQRFISSKAAAEHYALGGISLEQFAEACGGTIPQAVADYANAYGQEYDAWCEWHKAQEKTQQALENLT